MLNKIKDFFNRILKKEKKITEEEAENSRAAAKDRLHIVLMQDRANISADFLDLMREEIIEVIKKYIVVNEKEIDVRLTHSVQEDGTPNPPSLYANIPIVNIRNDMKARTEEEKIEEEKIEKSKKSIKKEEKESEKDNKNKKNKTNIDEDEKINIIIDKAEEIKNEVNQEEKLGKEKNKNENNKTEEKEKKK